eukprot:2188447-Prymnesium_polylepis.1
MGATTSRSAPAMRSLPTSAGLGPLSGAVLCVLAGDDASKQVLALGGTIVKRVEDATHCIVSSKLAASIDLTKSQRSKLLMASRCSVPVLQARWLDCVAQLSAEQHWSSDVPLEEFAPPFMAALVKEGQRLEHERRARLNRQRKRRRNNASQIAGSLDESWAYLMREQPEEVEEHELRRAIELSLLDSAVTLRRDFAPTAMPTTARTPEQVLGVPMGAGAEEIREAFKRRALE